MKIDKCPRKRRSLLCLWAGAIVLGLGSLQAAAQTADQTKARLEVGAGFLKSGDIELATKAFTQILDADATNWQARALLAIAHLSTRDLDKVEIEIRRLKVQNAPAATVTALERQVSGVRLANQLRDQVTALLQVGQWQEALVAVDQTDMPAPRKQLLQAYVAALRGEFDEARRLTSDPQFASFNASVAKRADEFQAAREQAVVALNFLGSRYCQSTSLEIRRCTDSRPLSALQQAAWEEIRSGEGKVSSPYMADRIKMPGMFNMSYALWTNAGPEFAKRVTTALKMMTRLVSLAPLHPEAIHAGVALAFYSGSLDSARGAAERSLNMTGTWMLRTRQCRKEEAWPNCGVGDDKIQKDLPAEGLVEFDRRSRVVRYHAVPTQGWLTSLVPTKGRVQFEVPFDQIAVIKSTPLSNRYGRLRHDSVLFDFGPKQIVPIQLDFMFLLYLGHELQPALAFKATEDVVKVAGELIPSAKVAYEAEMASSGGFLQALAMTGTMVAASSGQMTSGAAVAQQFQTSMAIQQQERSAEATRQAEFWRAIDELKAQDGRSMLDTALENDGLKQDLDALLRLALQ